MHNTLQLNTMEENITVIKTTMGVFVTLSRTSSSAIAERPRDASCLSVVSFNSTISRAQSSVISYFGFKLTIAYNYMLFCCLRGNVEASCRKHFLVTSCHQKKLRSVSSRYIYSFRQNTRTWQMDRQTDGRTDRHCITAQAQSLQMLVLLKFLPRAVARCPFVRPLHAGIQSKTLNIIKLFTVG